MTAINLSDLPNKQDKVTATGLLLGQGTPMETFMDQTSFSEKLVGVAVKLPFLRMALIGHPRCYHLQPTGRLSPSMVMCSLQ